MIKPMSHLKINECGHLKDKRFIVIDRYPEDLATGCTWVIYENGQVEKFEWDYRNPEVGFLGLGNLISKLPKE